jgi:hypothetical protein
MPASVIKHKQKLSYMNDQELAEYLKEYPQEKVERLQRLHALKNNRYMNVWNKSLSETGYPAVLSNTFQSTSKDAGIEFLDSLSHANNIEQAEVLGILYDHDWEHPHTREEIAQKYVSAPAEKRVEIDSIIKH